MIPVKYNVGSILYSKETIEEYYVKKFFSTIDIYVIIKKDGDKSESLYDDFYDELEVKNKFYTLKERRDLIIKNLK